MSVYVRMGTRAALSALGLEKFANVFDEAYQAAGGGPRAAAPHLNYAPNPVLADAVAGMQPMNRLPRAAVLRAGLPMAVLGLGGAVAGGIAGYDEDQTAGGALGGGALGAAVGVPATMRSLENRRKSMKDYNETAARVRESANRYESASREAIDQVNELNRQGGPAQGVDPGAFVDELRKRTGKKDRHIMAMLHPDARGRTPHGVPNEVLEDAFHHLNNGAPRRPERGAAAAAAAEALKERLRKMKIDHLLRQRQEDQKLVMQRMDILGDLARKQRGWVTGWV